MITTHDTLTDSQQKLVDEGQEAILGPWSNAAQGTYGGDVMTLCRYGLWEAKRRHEANDPNGSYTVYGPKDA